MPVPWRPPSTVSLSNVCRQADSSGEVYVLNDGGETDLDLGNYERYLNVSLGKDNNVTTGKVYSHVIEREVSAPRRAPLMIASW